MKKIMLVCSAGMSTSLLVTKMRTAAIKKGISVDIFAVSEAELKNHTNDVDVVLLGPQVRFLLNKMEKTLEPKGISIAVIDSVNYGMMNGEAVLEQALDIIGNK
ncbi:PTS sugar transporter subunit IIB [Paramaledivibacter caminithermalis]|jgi:PTS system cellobiose-specific IIB component|uniref:PTS system, cellobiose-specific IIB component n=1 Tax=Paramaledivibacter caminithermalis (strain DSM 15212 / CIP 107654 / DViRD3) TaxID=1121301 RepID=A0A1M6PGR9_PARC5|nr:PTS sugar transporter subunit IIB [Paramaledivibacter caminithermalis]SHK07102.1 PTS system, cellobiose-specific IIB component [Paramaledivibacter caminithermalis DSM 15212]